MNKISIGLRLITKAFCLLSIFLFSSFASAQSDFDLTIPCEGCSATSMLNTAKYAATSNGITYALVYSHATATIRGYKVVLVSGGGEPGGPSDIRNVTEVTVDSQVKTDWAVLNTLVTQLKTSRYIDFDDLTNGSTTCATADSLSNIACLGMVTTALTSNFLVDYTLSAAVLKIMSKMIDSEFEAFNVWVCYEDGICIEFEAVAPWFSSLGWAATGNTSGGTDTDGNVGGGGYDGSSGTTSSGTTFIISCGVWYTYSGTTADGTYCESWNVTMIR